MTALFRIDWVQIVDHLAHLLVAYALALPIGWERERSRRSFGLRTFPLVAVVSCGFMLTGIAVIDTTDGEARIMEGIITGIGFIGGGAILKEGGNVAGVSTATSIWNTGAVGLAVAYNRYEIAIVLALLNFVTLFVVGRIKQPLINGDSEES